MNSIFVTGTDTEIGKTMVTATMVEMAAAEQIRAIGMKPIASGFVDGKNDDIEALRAVNSIELPNELINQFAFVPAIAPHIAAAEVGETIEFADILEARDKAQALADLLIIEGVGGWMVPLDEQNALSVQDLALALKAPVVLVVGLRLGCINHAILTENAILQSGISVIGWVANCIDPNMQQQRRNIDYLKHQLKSPHLFTLGHVEPGQRPVNSVSDDEGFLKYLPVQSAT